MVDMEKFIHFETRNPQSPLLDLIDIAADQAGGSQGRVHYHLIGMRIHVLVGRTQLADRLGVLGLLAQFLDELNGLVLLLDDGEVLLVVVAVGGVEEDCGGGHEHQLEDWQSHRLSLLYYICITPIDYILLLKQYEDHTCVIDYITYYMLVYIDSELDSGQRGNIPA